MIFLKSLTPEQSVNLNLIRLDQVISLYRADLITLSYLIKSLELFISYLKQNEKKNL